jgi:hypothetical protein
MPLRWPNSWRMVAPLVSKSVRGEVIGRRVVEGELAGLDHLHHLGCDHRLGDAGDTELIVDPYVSNAVRLPPRSTPCAVGGHHRGGHPAFAGHVAQDRPELRDRAALRRLVRPES